LSEPPVAGAAPRVLRNAAAVFGGQLIDKASTLLFVLYVTRRFAPGFYGRYAEVVTLATVLEQVTDLGLYTLIVRETARDRARASRFFGSFLGLRLLLAALSIGGLFAYGAWVASPPAPLHLLLVGLALLPKAVASLLYAALHAFERMQWTSLLLVLSGTFYSLVSIALLASGAGLTGVFAAWLAASLIALGGLWHAAARGGIELSLRSDPNFLRAMLRAARPLAAWHILNILYYRADVLIVKQFAGAAQAGFWYAATKVSEILLFLPLAVQIALLPGMSEASARDPERLERVLTKSLRAVALVGCPIAVGLAALRQPLVQLLFSGGYAEVAELLFWISPVLLLLFFLVVLNNLVLTSTKIATYAAGLGALTAFKLGLDWWWVPARGALGAAQAAALSELGLFAFAVWLAARLIPASAAALARAAGPPLVAALVMGAALVELDLGLAGGTVLGALLYIVLLLAGRVLKADDLQQVRQLWGSRGKRGGR
jgi:O-antigen/teichoic acid export membrane protein